MKITREYEVWVGGDMIGDDLTYNQARALAEEEFKNEAKQEYPADVVVDEHSYFKIETLEDLDRLGA